MVPQIAKNIDDMFANAPAPTKTESEGQFALSFVSMLGNIKLFLLVICGAVTFTILLVSGNTMAMSVRERISEVGVLKTLGFNNDAILGIIIGEAITIALIGGVIGLVLAEVLTAGVGKTAGAFMPQLNNLSVTPFTALVALGVALFVGLRQLVHPGLERRAHEHSRFAQVIRLNNMAIPLSYNFRNLIVRKTTTLMTAAGIAMTVAVLLAVLGLVSGLTSAFATSGDPLHVLVMRQGGNAELTSVVTQTQFQIIKAFPGIAVGS